MFLFFEAALWESFGSAGTPFIYAVATSVVAGIVGVICMIFNRKQIKFLKLKKCNICCKKTSII